MHVCRDIFDGENKMGVASVINCRITSSIWWEDAVSSDIARIHSTMKNILIAFVFAERLQINPFMMSIVLIIRAQKSFCVYSRIRIFLSVIKPLIIRNNEDVRKGKSAINRLLPHIKYLTFVTEATLMRCTLLVESLILLTENVYYMKWNRTYAL